MSSALLIAALSGVWVIYSDAAAARSRFANWDLGRDYGIFTPRRVGNDFTEIISGGNATESALVFDLYLALDARGAVYVDSTEYEPRPGAGPSNPDPTAADPRSLVVNTNYLRRFPVRDSSGHIVAVSDATTDWVVLVPARLRGEEEQIREYFQRLRTGPGGAASSNAAYGRPTPPAVTTQQVAIIWTEDDQTVFGFNPLVDPDNGGNIVDPIIQVMTTANSVGTDRGNMMTGGADSALKVPLEDGDTAKTLTSIEPLLKSLRLDDNFPSLVTLDGWVSQQVAAIQGTLQFIATLSLALLGTLLLLSAQSVSIMFERYSRRIAVRRLFGQRFLDTYREVFVLFALVWALQLAAALAVNQMGMNPFAASHVSALSSATGAAPFLVVAATTGAIAAVEFLLQALMLSRMQSAGVVRVLKEEF